MLQTRAAMRIKMALPVSTIRERLLGFDVETQAGSDSLVM